MPGSEYYDHTTYPSTGASGSSAALRAELDLIETGFGKLPDLSGNGSKIVAVNSGATALEALTTTGTGSGVRATSPTLVTPTLGVATVTSVNKVAVTAPATSATLTLADGSTLATSGANSATLTTTGATNVTLPTTGTLATLAGTETLTNKTIDASNNTFIGVITATSTTTLTNKTIDAASNTLTGVALSGAIGSSGLTMATSRLLGRTTASTGAVEEVTVGDGVTLTGGALGLDQASTADVETGTDTTKPVTASAMQNGKIVLSASQATTSGVSIDFTSIPSWVKRFTLQLIGTSTNGASIMLLQVGTGGSPTTTGYLGNSDSLGATPTQYTTGFGLGSTGQTGAATIRHGSVVFSYAGSNTWVCTGLVSDGQSTGMAATAGTIALAGALDMLRLTTVNGTDAFDAGSAILLYE